MPVTIDPEVKKLLQPNLTDNEFLLWAARPKQGFILEPLHVPFFLISIIWCSVLWEQTTISGSDFFSILFKLLLLISGICFGLFRPFLDKINRLNICYGITDRRILIKGLSSVNEIITYDIKTNPQLDRSGNDDGSGTITLNYSTSWFGKNGIKFRGQEPEPTLNLIENVREVYELLIKIKSTEVK